ncbi:MAG: ATP-binding protein [Candidatus Omnitrophota bacterium]
MRGIYDRGFNGNNTMIPRRVAVNIYHKFSMAFALMSVIPFLAFFYLLVGKLGTANLLIGEIGIILSVALFISLLGLIDLRKSYEEHKNNRRDVFRSAKLSSLGRLIAEVAHEVNNPLQAIIGRARLSLMEIQDNGQVNENMEIIINECNRAKEVTHRLLMFSAPRKNTVKKANINNAVGTAVKIFTHEYPRTDIKILERYSERVPDIFMDKHEICEVVINLLKNSFDAMPKGGKVKITTKKYQGCARIDIEDTGVGIPEEDIEKLFDPFFSSKGDGKGVGLSVCYGIIKAHDGDLRYNSIMGKGTMASMFLPFAR